MSKVLKLAAIGQFMKSEGEKAEATAKASVSKLVAERGFEFLDPETIRFTQNGAVFKAGFEGEEIRVDQLLQDKERKTPPEFRLLAGYLILLPQAAEEAGDSVPPGIKQRVEKIEAIRAATLKPADVPEEEAAVVVETEPEVVAETPPEVEAAADEPAENPAAVAVSADPEPVVETPVAVEAPPPDETTEVVAPAPAPAVEPPKPRRRREPEPVVAAVPPGLPTRAELYAKLSAFRFDAADLESSGEVTVYNWRKGLELFNRLVPVPLAVSALVHSEGATRAVVTLQGAVACADGDWTMAGCGYCAAIHPEAPAVAEARAMRRLMAGFGFGAYLWTERGRFESLMPGWEDAKPAAPPKPVTPTPPAPQAPADEFRYVRPAPTAVPRPTAPPSVPPQPVAATTPPPVNGVRRGGFSLFPVGGN